MLTFNSFCDFIKDELACFQSIEDFKIRLIDNGSLEIDLEVHELNYIADILSIGRINEYLEERLKSVLPLGLAYGVYININMKMISSIDEIMIEVKL